jgi:DNA-binding CsgD family transcriptional regulator
MPVSPLIGRVGELDAISSAWNGTNHRVVLVTGEAGSGKSRLVAEAVGRLDPAPDLVLSGAARPHGPAPYDWLASVLAGRDLDDLPVPAPVLAWLTQRDEDWLTRWDEEPHSKGRLAPATLLRAATDVIRALLRGKRGVLVVEDLHDLDPASMTLVAELAADLSGPHPSLQALMLVTSRSLHESAFPPVAARTLRRLTGPATVVRAHLAPFTTRETAELIEACYGVVPAPETVRGAHARTGGNPFWLTELIAARAPHDGPDALATGPLPPHLAALLVERLDGEPPLVGRVARAAALLCDPADRDQVQTDQLHAVCGDDLEPALRRLVDLGMLLIAPDGPLRLRTPLLREALAGAALPRERLAIHRRARAFAAELSDDDALARHAAALGRRAEAADAARRAIQRHRARPEATLAAVGLGIANADDPVDFFGTGVSAALATGRFELAADYATRWLDQTGDAEAHRQLATVLWRLGDVDGHQTHLRRAAALTAGASPARARQLAAEAETLLPAMAEPAPWPGRSDEVHPAGLVAAAEAALQAAIDAGEPAAKASATVTLGTALALTGEHERGVALLRAGRHLAEQADDLLAYARAVNNLVALCLPTLGIAAGWRLFDEAVDAIGRIGLAFSAGRTTSVGHEHALRAGDLARAEALVWGRLPIETDPLERAHFTGAAGLLAVERGDDALAARLLIRATAEVADLGRRPWSSTAGILAVAVAARDGHPSEVTRCFADYVEHHGDGRPDRLAEAARWALAGGAPAADVGRLVTAEALNRPRTGAQLRLALAASAGRDAEVAELAAPALAGPTAVAWQDAEVHAIVGQALMRLGRAGAAREHAERASTLLARWPGWRRDEAETLLHSLRAGGDLTAREIEVLGCLAAGMSNQQVASSLGISIRTVTVHVSNLLRKTGAASRTEAALWAVRHRLVRGR